MSTFVDGLLVFLVLNVLAPLIVLASKFGSVDGLSF